MTNAQKLEVTPGTKALPDNSNPYSGCYKHILQHGTEIALITPTPSYKELESFSKTFSKVLGLQCDWTYQNNNCIFLAVLPTESSRETVVKSFSQLRGKVPVRYKLLPRL